MKFLIALLLATLALNGVLSLPARDPSNDAEYIGGPRRVSTRVESDDDDSDEVSDDGFRNFKGVIDTGAGYPFLQPNPSVINFGFFDSFDDILRRFRARLFPTSVFGSGAADDSDEDSDGVGTGLLGFPAVKFDPKKANTTSTVKVVDGNKVEINETVYGDENSLFKVRVVNIRPLEEGENVDETKTISGADDDSAKPVTSGPETIKPVNELVDEDSGEDAREPLSKKNDNDNEIKGNIDDPEQGNIAKTIDSNNKMLPTTNDDDLLATSTFTNEEFVTDNNLKQQFEEEAAAEEVNGNGNNEFVGNNDNAEQSYEATTIENNEDTELNDNLNESLSAAAEPEHDYVANKQQNYNDELKDKEHDDYDEVDDENLKEAIVDKLKTEIDFNDGFLNEKSENLKYREDASSSSDDDDDDEDTATEMHPTFNDEWGSLNEANSNADDENELSNDIDVYDVEPIDLSNDIAVNDSPNLPINPDAEFIEGFGNVSSVPTMAKFEKLSLNQDGADGGEPER